MTLITTLAIFSALLAIAPLVLGARATSWIDSQFDHATLWLSYKRPLEWYRKTTFSQSIKWTMLVSTLFWGFLSRQSIQAVLKSGTNSLMSDEFLRMLTCLFIASIFFCFFSFLTFILTASHRAVWMVGTLSFYAVFLHTSIINMSSHMILSFVSLLGYFFFDGTYCYYDLLAFNPAEIDTPHTISICDRGPSTDFEGHATISGAWLFLGLGFGGYPIFLLFTGTLIVSFLMGMLSAFVRASEIISWRLSEFRGGPAAGFFGLVTAVLVITRAFLNN